MLEVRDKCRFRLTFRIVSKGRLKHLVSEQPHRIRIDGQKLSDMPEGNYPVAGPDNKRPLWKAAVVKRGEVTEVL